MNNSLNDSAKNALMGLIKERLTATTGRKKKGGSRRSKKRMTRRR
jgi:hypothetical protein